MNEVAFSRAQFRFARASRSLLWNIVCRLWGLVHCARAKRKVRLSVATSTTTAWSSWSSHHVVTVHSAVTTISLAIASATTRYAVSVVRRSVASAVARIPVVPAVRRGIVSSLVAAVVVVSISATISPAPVVSVADHAVASRFFSRL